VLNRLLMEINCPPAKGPPANVPPKQANPIELKRALAAITTRRKNLNAAIAKLSQLTPGTYAHECQKLRVQTATAWLNFTTTRWKMLSEFSKKYGKKHPDTDKLTAFGDVHAGHAEKHHQIVHSGSNEAHPPLADIEFHHEKGHLVHAGTEHHFEVPHDPHAEVKHPGHAAGKAPGKEPEEEPEEEPEQEPEKAPEKPKEPEQLVYYHKAISAAGLEGLTIGQKKTVIDTAAAFHPSDHHGFMDALSKKGISIAGGAASEVLKHVSKPPAKPETKPEKEPEKPQGPKDEPESVATVGGLTTHEKEALDAYAASIAHTTHFGVEAIGKLKQYAADALGLHISSQVAGDVAHAASQKTQTAKVPEKVAQPAKMPQSLGDYNPDSQDKIADIVNKVVMDAGGHAGLGVAGKEQAYLAAKDEIDKQLAKAGLPLHPGDVDHELHAAMKASKLGAAAEPAKAPEPEVDPDAPGPSGHHPWAISDYTPTEKDKIGKIANEVIAEKPVTHAKSAEPSPELLDKFKLELDKAGIPLKHADAHALMTGALEKFKAATVKPTPPPPPPPGPSTQLSADQHEKLKEKVKEHLLKHAGEAAHGMLPSHSKQLLKDVGIENAAHEVHAIPHDIAKEHLKEMGKLEPEHVAHLAKMADTFIKGKSDAEEPVDKGELIHDLQKIAADKYGKIPDASTTLDIVNSSIENAKEKPKPYADYSNQEKEEIHQAAKQLAVKYATLNKDQHEFKSALAQHLAQNGKPLSQAAVDMVAGNAWANHTNQSWDALSADKKEMLKAIAKKAFTSKGDLVAAIANSGIAHLSPEGFKGLADEVAKETTPPEDEKPVPSLGALKTQVFNYWDERAKKETPDEWTFVPGAAESVIKPALEAHKPFSTLYGTNQNHWLHDLWAVWHTSHAAKAASEPAPAAPPAPHPAAEGPAPPPTTASPTHFAYTKHQKIMSAHHFTPQQKEHLDHKIAEALAGGAHLTAGGEPSDWKLAGVAAKIHAEFKNDWGAAGVTGVSKDLIKKLVQDAAAKPHAPEGVAPSPTTHDPPAAQPDDYLAMIKAAPAGTLNAEHHASFVDIAHKVFVQKKWGGDFASPKQKKFFESMLKKVKAALPATPTAPPPTIAPEPTPAPEPEITDETPESNPIGMTKEQLDKFISTDKPTSGPTPPPLTHPGWKKKGAFGGGGAHDKSFLATDKNFHPTGKTFKTGATHAWMFKGDAGAPFVAHGEAAAGRLQKLLGIGATDHIWVETDHNGVTGVMQHFEANPSFRDNGEHEPWKTHVHKDKIAKQLQKAVIANWLNDDYDDHNGNFVADDKGNVTPVDHGQAARFFDSSMTLTKKLKWEAPSPTVKGFQSVSQDQGKGFPGRMLRDWSDGEDIALMPLTSPEFESVIARAESIPSDTYKKMWKPYAEGSVQKFGAVAGYSAVKSDQTVDGFLDGMDARRKKIRSEVGDFYAQLAKQRAASLKAKGDARPISAIESEVRDQMGIDEFLQGKPVVAKVDKKALAAATEPGPPHNWLDPKLPTMSQIPDDHVRVKQGHAGVDLMVGGQDVKDGRLQMFHLGNNTMATFILDTGARTKLESRLPGAAGGASAIAAPEPPDIQPFEPPPKPTFSAKGGDFHKKIIGAAGDTSSATKTLPDGTVVPVTKIEKYVYKHFKEGAGGVKYHYLKQGIDAASAAAQSADPVEKAAGEHYLSEFNRLGHLAPDGSYALKAASEIPTDEQEIKRFEPAKAHLAAQKKAKANVEAAHAQAVETAKAAWEEKKTKAEADYQKSLKKYEDDTKAADADAVKAGKLAATKLSYYPVPEAKLKSNPAGDNLVSKEATWDGTFGKPFDKDENEMDTYQLDLTDAVTGVAVAGGKLAPTKRLLVHYVPGHMGHGSKRKYPARGGTVRVQFPEGATKEQIADYTKKVAHILGTDIRPADEKDHELTYLRRMAWLRRIEGYGVGSVKLADEPSGSAEKKIEWWVDKFKQTPTAAGRGPLGYDPRYEPERTANGKLKTAAGQAVYKKNADGSNKRNANYQPLAHDSGEGRAAFNRFDVTGEEMKKWMDDGLTLSKASLTYGKEKESLLSMINMGGIYATEKRAHIGLGVYGKALGGISPGADVQSGGANDIFLFISKVKHDSGWAQFDPRLLLETSAWHHKGDNYGTKVDYSHGQVSNRTGSVQENRMVCVAEAVAAASASGPSKEVMVGDRISFWKWLAQLNLSKYDIDPKPVIEKLKAAGITHAGPDKRPLEEVIK